MKYKGIVTFNICDGGGVVYSITMHNDGTENLQLAFANMLAGYDTKKYRPNKIRCSLGDFDLTGLNRRQGESPKYYAECEAIIPIDSIDKRFSDTYSVLSEGGSLAQFVPTISDEIREQLEEQAEIGSIDEGMQINIKWKMYLQI